MMRTKKLTILAFIAVMVALISLGGGTAGAGGPWYVSPSGDDLNDCLSTGTACLTINGAIGKASSSDTINVAAGTYIEALNVNKSLTLIGAAGAKIKPDNSTPKLDGGVCRVAVYINEVDNVTVEGFEIDGTGGDVHFGIYGFNSTNTTVTTNVVHDLITCGDYYISGIGILFFGWAHSIDDTLIQRNTVSYTDHEGIWISAFENCAPACYAVVSNRNVIKDNIVHHTFQNLHSSWPCGWLWGGAIGLTVAQGSSIEGNTIHDTGCNQRDILLYGAFDVSITDNTFLHSGAAGVPDGWAQPVIEHSSCVGGYCAASSDLTITDNTITFDTTDAPDGFVVYLETVGGTNSFSGNVVTLTGTAPTGLLHGLPLGFNEGHGTGATGNWTIQGNTFDGKNLANGGAGIRLYGYLPSTAVISISDNRITRWANGIKSDALANAALVTVHNNNITGNSLNGFFDSGSATQINAESNWWGNPRGPCTPGDQKNPAGKCKGKGDAVSGNVDYEPWLLMPVVPVGP